MKILKSIVIVTVILLVVQEMTLMSSPEQLRGDYMGQTPPGMTPKVFAPGIVSKPDRSELNAIYSPDYKEFYFSVREPKKYVIMVMKQQNGTWTEAVPASFSGTYSEADPFFSIDGKILYYVSKRPEMTFGPPHDVWAVKRTADGWSEPFNLGKPVNSKSNEIYPALTTDGTMYFVSDREGSLGRRDVYRAIQENGRYTKVENLRGSISTTYDEGDVYVAPDESYIIFVSRDRPGSHGSGDLYISFRQTDGQWTPAKNMGGTINSKYYDFCPVVSPDGKYFFYTKNGDVYWVDAKIIDQFKPASAKQ